MTDDPYVYPGSSVLINKFNIRDQAVLDRVERNFATKRAEMHAPAGDFDLAHLQAIHHHLFQDVYDWSGQIRTVDLAKGASQFQPCRFIETGMANVHQRLVQSDFLRGLTAQDFASRAGEIMGDVNYVHPFREGNGRAQLIYLRQLSEQAGHPMDLTQLQGEHWIDVSIAAHRGYSQPMAHCIAAAITSRIDGPHDLPYGQSERNPDWHAQCRDMFRPERSLDSDHQAQEPSRRPSR